MKGYGVLVGDPHDNPAGLVFAEVSDARDRYALPSAFSVYWNAVIQKDNGKTHPQ